MKTIEDYVKLYNVELTEENLEKIEAAEKEIESIQQLYKEFSKRLNVLGNNERFLTVFFDCLTNDHRTMQQSFFRNFFELVKKYSKLGSNDYDKRNEAALVACKNIVSNISLGLPTI